MIRWRERTLQTKTALILTLFTWISAALIGISSRSALNLMVHRHIDLELNDVATDFHAILNTEAYPFSETQIGRWNRRLAIHPRHRMFVQVFDNQGNLKWNSITAPTPPPNADLSANEHRSIDIYRVLHRPMYLRIRNPSDRSSMTMQTAVLQVGCAMELANSALQELDSWILPVALALLLCVPPLAWFISDWLLFPLRELTKETDCIKIQQDRWITQSGNHDEIDRLALTVNQLLQRTRESIQHNEDWIANAAHQLRGPLAAIMSNIEVCADRATDNKSQQMLDKVTSECQNLKKIINQLLLLGETNSNRKSPLRINVEWDRQVSQAVGFFEALAEEKGVSLTLDQIETATVKGNPDHLRYVIQNLLDNAIKYTDSNGHIRVSLRKDNSSNQAVLCVADTGIGISDEDQKKLGQRFFRCNSGRDPANTPRGSGLGLSIVLNIIESMQGNFEVKSQLGKGTKIHVSLPLYSSDQNEDDQDDQDTSGSSDYSSGISSPGLRSGNSVINIAESVLVNARNSSPKV